MMRLFTLNLLTVLYGILHVVCGGKYTVTDEAWFDVRVTDRYGPGKHYTGRFELALFGETVPKTVYNFVSLTRGISIGGQWLHYKNIPIHRIRKDLAIQMGDVTKGDGSGGTSIYGRSFKDENFVLTHRSPGWVGMANHGKDTNHSQFYIIMKQADWLNGQYVVFAKVIRGFNVLERLQDIPTDPDTKIPMKEVYIIDCGIIKKEGTYDLLASAFDTY